MYQNDIPHRLLMHDLVYSNTLIFFFNFYIQRVIFATSYVALICFVFFCTCKFNVYVVVQFYPLFKFYFSLFLTHYHTLPYPKTKGNKI